MVEWSIAAFGGAGVAAIVVACPRGHAYEPAAAAPAGEGRDAVPDIRVVEGGATRSASVINAMRAVETDLVAIHDAARPLLTPELVTGVVATLAADPDAAGAIAAAPLADTVKRAPGGSSPALAGNRPVNAGLVVVETVDRAELWAAQTPQVFRVEALREALKGDSGKVAAATDEATLVEAAGGRVLIHPVEAENLKVTTPLDFRVADSLLSERASR
jgi:2-C-methyl-D-erythritol 4-phosphate cytidylyltransferase